MSGSGLVFRGEGQILADEVRAAAPGEFIELPDGVVHYEIVGTRGAQTVVLISGFSVPYFIWDRNVDALVGAGSRVLRYDLYGRGFSDRPDTVYNRELYDSQLWHLLEALGIEGPVDLVGLSMGGAIAVAFADQHPQAVRKICLIDPAGLPVAQPFVARLVQLPLVGEAIMELLGNEVLLSQLQGYLFGDRAYSELAERFREQMQYAGFKRALLSTLRSGVTTGAADAYAGVGERGLPVMLIWGREDRVVPFSLHEEVRRLIPHLEFHAIADAAHIPQYEQPEVVNPLLVRFLKPA